MRSGQPRAEAEGRVPFFASLLLAGLLLLASAPPTEFRIESARETLEPVAASMGSSGPLAEGPAPTDIHNGRAEPRLVRDIDGFPGGNSHPEAFMNLSGTLLFFADDRVAGTELWRSDGREAGTFLVKDINPGANGSTTSEEVATAAGFLYFTADDGASGTELWRTDGTDLGTVPVKDIHPGAGSSSPAHLANLDDVVYFSADDGGNGTELWRTDGTAGGTVLVRDIKPGLGGSEPADLTISNRILYFTADDGVTGRELWRSDGTGPGTWLVRDIYPGVRGFVVNLEDVNGVLYFTACDNVWGCELWKTTDGTVLGTELVKDIQVGRESGGAYVKRSVGGRLYAAADDGVSGTELWITDGSEAGTVQVKDIYPGSNGSHPQLLRDIGGLLYFTADDGLTGRELWRSDGTEAGTARVSDIRPGAGGSGELPGNGPWGMTVVNGKIFFSACDDVSGCEPWTTDGTPAGTVLVTDLNPGGGNSGPSEHTNIKEVLFFAADNGTTGEELWMLDPTPPRISVPEGGLVVEATERGGAVVTYEAITAVDNFDGTIVPTCAPAPGTMVPLGTTTASCTASDSSGNVATRGFQLMVQDTTAPSWSDLQDVVAEATGPNGAAVTYEVVATDLVDPSPAVSCSRASGAIFPLGTTEVSCRASDASANEATVSFNVTVWDTTPALVPNPEDVVAEATGPNGAAVTYEVVATDLVDPSPAVSCSRASGATFPLGTTRVTCTATDDAGNEATVSLNVTVRDTTSPAVLSDPEDVVAEATGPNGAAVTYEVVATDLVDPDPMMSCSRASGATFPLGNTTVTCAVRDNSGNEATVSLKVTVQDTTEPTLHLSDISRRATTSSGVVVTFQVAAHDVVDRNPLVDCEPASGSTFPIGATKVTCTATDAEGNVATGSFQVRIAPPEGIALLGVYVDPWFTLIVIVLAIAAFLVGRAWARKRRRDREEL